MGIRMYALMLCFYVICIKHGWPCTRLVFNKTAPPNLDAGTAAPKSTAPNRRKPSARFQKDRQWCHMAQPSFAPKLHLMHAQCHAVFGPTERSRKLHDLSAEGFGNFCLAETPDHDLLRLVNVTVACGMLDSYGGLN